MSKVFFDVGVSLDGYLGGLNLGPGNPLGFGGSGIRLLEHIDPARLTLEQVGASSSPLVTHIDYHVVR